MYSMISRLSARQLLRRQVPTLIGALAIAELFYKWHSFLLETGGFLLTWYALDATVSLAERMLDRNGKADPPR